MLGRDVVAKAAVDFSVSGRLRVTVLFTTTTERRIGAKTGSVARSISRCIHIRDRFFTKIGGMMGTMGPHDALKLFQD